MADNPNERFEIAEILQRKRQDVEIAHDIREAVFSIFMAQDRKALFLNEAITSVIGGFDAV